MRYAHFITKPAFPAGWSLCICQGEWRTRRNAYVRFSCNSKAYKPSIPTGHERVLCVVACAERRGSPLETASCSALATALVLISTPHCTLQQQDAARRAYIQTVLLVIVRQLVVCEWRAVTHYTCCASSMKRVCLFLQSHHGRAATCKIWPHLSGLQRQGLHVGWEDLYSAENSG